MQIKSINISNLFSFPYVEEFKSPTAIFDTKKGTVNVLIGPNGAGKTNFLTIIDQIVKIGVFKDYILDTDTKSKKDTIILAPNKQHSLEKHFDTTTKKSKVEITLNITINDQENLLFIQKYRDFINEMIKNYSTLNIEFTTTTSKEIQNTKDIKLVFEINENEIILQNTSTNTSIEKAIIEYFQHQELIQIFIILYNTQFKNNTQKNLFPLKNTFSSLSTERIFDKEKSDISPLERNHYIGQNNNQDISPIAGYYLCVKKIWNIINQSSEENRDIPHNPNQNRKEKLNNSIFYKSLIHNVKKYLEQDLDISFEGQDIHINLKDKNGQIHRLDQLSHGEQSLLHIIFTIYGYDLKQGILIIDSPEMHFHPQMQKRLIRMLEKLSKNIQTQIIISTYSPIFINESNISNVYRFSKHKGCTEIKTPGNTIMADESSLVHILKFENAAKIFFVDHIIMVEGEIDAYFFEYYLEYLHRFPERKQLLTNYEIVNINGKGGYKKRNKFLSKFGIQSYFIGDWDNIIDYGFMGQADLNHYYLQAKKYYATLKKSKIHLDRHYTRLVNTVRNLFPEKYHTIIHNIDELHKKNVFILKKGDIESYMGLHSKGLEETINFCHRDFEKWINNKDFDTQRTELEEIFKLIFQQ